MAGRLEGKVALVAGGGGGIGGAGARGLAREGARVICGDVRIEDAEATASAIRAAGGQAIGVRLDVTSRASCEEAVARAVAEHGRLDILFNSAGIAPNSSFLDVTDEEWARVLAVNLTGMFQLGQVAARQMVRQGQGGSIIQITSQLSEAGIPNKVSYLASKGGGRSLTMGMAIDLAPHGIRVNAIGPGPTRTNLTRERLADADVLRWTLERIPLGRLGEPDDLAGAVLYLAGDESRWVTGTTIMVDGGYLAR